MSPRPKNAPKARLTACAPLRLSITSFGLGSAVCPGSFSPESPLTAWPEPASTGGATAGPPVLGVAGAPVTFVPLGGGAVALDPAEGPVLLFPPGPAVAEPPRPLLVVELLATPLVDGGPDTGAVVGALLSTETPPPGLCLTSTWPASRAATTAVEWPRLNGSLNVEATFPTVCSNSTCRPGTSTVTWSGVF